MIAVGNAEENPVVASVLRRRPVDVPPNLRAPVVLSFYDSGEGPWTLAVAADEPELAARVGVEMAAQVNRGDLWAHLAKYATPARAFSELR